MLKKIKILVIFFLIFIISNGFTAFSDSQKVINDKNAESYKNSVIRSEEEFNQSIHAEMEELGTVIEESTKETRYSTQVLVFAFVCIFIIILTIVILIIVICKKGFSQQQIQQEQYIQAFKIFAATQNQANKIMLGGVTDIYGDNGPLKLAGSSVWSGKPELSNGEFSEVNEEELKKLAIKCEEIGSKIDYVTGRKNNSKNVSELVYKISLELGLSSSVAMLYFCAAMVYDAGFLGIDPDILSAGSLNEEEKEAMKVHVSLAQKYLRFVPRPYWSIFKDAVMKHHENMDGSGYPKGLKGDEIPIIARLIHVAESYVSISSKRSYRAATDKETAVEKLKSQPDLYDINIVEALEKIV